MEVTDELRETVRTELPEIAEIGDPVLRDKVVEVWAMALAPTSFACIADIPASGNPGTPALKKGSQADHIRGVARLAMAICDSLTGQIPDLEVDRDVLIAGALCHDVGKPWEFDPKNQERWRASPGTVGWPSVRHPPMGVHLCLTVGLPEGVAHIAGGHSGEGELIRRSLEGTIVHHADYAFWRVLTAGGLMGEGKPV